MVSSRRWTRRKLCRKPKEEAKKKQRTDLHKKIQGRWRVEWPKIRISEYLLFRST
ncbi:hypothetical protein PDIG_68510 [Penicillium digitatum PHI26]|uniref:Uncharacterized protein n=2 Tax=Penicillium digitatum TaxID=36651 RepID=K9G4T6_PEND2|nr:hypothetical protein PDIP_77800 [Penicillium digitatum Pd1]EKV06655.1 hypothetical protein PDIP_77800 [Penicillium digitatum Pd1]EKV08276.1 hypothetical protein PDIG_68510 [Penicillium digitatum PHI26]